jgi:hypothetical protein
VGEGRGARGAGGLGTRGGGEGGFRGGEGGRAGSGMLAPGAAGWGAPCDAEGPCLAGPATEGGALLGTRRGSLPMAAGRSLRSIASMAGLFAEHGRRFAEHGRNFCEVGPGGVPPRHGLGGVGALLGGGLGSETRAATGLGLGSEGKALAMLWLAGADGGVVARVQRRSSHGCTATLLEHVGKSKAQN